MADISIQMVSTEGEPLGRLREGALAFIAEVEQAARDRGLPKRSALGVVLRERLEENGLRVDDDQLATAVRDLDDIRRGARPQRVELIISRAENTHARDKPKAGMTGEASRSAVERDVPVASSKSTNQVLSFFEVERMYPDDEARAWYERLVGIDEHKRRLLVELEMLLHPEQVEEWSRRHHKNRVLRLCALQQNRVPLVLLEGDVGTGKTALAETIGDALARRMRGTKKVHLLKVNTQIRGTGQVGEMSDLIAQAFAQAEARARSSNGEPVLLLIDEADALAASRDTQQMHHEDKAGLNTILQRLDNLRLDRPPLAVIFITNRPDALDPAVRRRSALRLTFDRPNAEARRQIIETSLEELKLTSAEITELVRLTGEHAPENKGVPFTASDITDRLLAGALREAFGRDRALRIDDLIEQARGLDPSPVMGTM